MSSTNSCPDGGVESISKPLVESSDSFDRTPIALILLLFSFQGCLISAILALPMAAAASDSCEGRALRESHEPASPGELFNINLVPSDLLFKLRKQTEGFRVGLNFKVPCFILFFFLLHLVSYTITPYLMNDLIIASPFKPMFAYCKSWTQNQQHIFSQEICSKYL